MITNSVLAFIFQHPPAAVERIYTCAQCQKFSYPHRHPYKMAHRDISIDLTGNPGTFYDQPATVQVTTAPNYAADAQLQQHRSDTTAHTSIPEPQQENDVTSIEPSPPLRPTSASTQCTRRRWVNLPEEAEVGLLKEVQARGAHLAGFGRADELFQEVAKSMNESGLLPWKTDTKNCTDRFKYLIKSWKKRDKCNQAKSGTTENFTELDHLFAVPNLRHINQKENIKFVLYFFFL